MATKRIRVLYRKYQIGDLVDGYRITGFGKVWEAKEVDRETLQPTSNDRCRCGAEYIHVQYGLCYKCTNEIHGTPKKFQYAYLEDEPEYQPSIFKE